MQSARLALGVLAAALAIPVLAQDASFPIDTDDEWPEVQVGLEGGVFEAAAGRPRDVPIGSMNVAAYDLVTAPLDELLAVHAALDSLAAEDTAAADLVKLRYFAGMSMPDAAEALAMPLRSAERLWTFARAWLRHEIRKS